MSGILILAEHRRGVLRDATLEAIEFQYLEHAYKLYGNVRDAAKSLGITPSTFVRKRQKHTEKKAGPKMGAGLEL